MKSGEKNFGKKAQSKKLKIFTLHSKRAQMKISFGMIFSIILIIVFLAFAFWGIKKFLGIQEETMVLQFKSDLQDNIDKLWEGPQGQQTLEYKLPKKIEGVCLKEDDYENLYFEPKGKFIGTTIEHIDWDNTGELCFEDKEGIVEITLTKDFGETLVTISRN